MKQLLALIFERKYFKIFLLVTLSALFSEVLGQVDWTKYGSNPILLPGAPGTWDNVGFPNVCVLLIGTTYHMWYTGNDGSNMRIGHATSPDGINWTKDPANPVLNLGAPGSWDDYWVYFPCVIYYGGLFHMWYDGNEGPPNYYENIGHATSLDGINWTKDPMNPVLTRGPAGSWDNLSIGPGFSYADGSTIHLWYDGSDGTFIRSGHATSTDGGTTWVKDPNNPILNVGSPSSWDYPRAQVSSIVYNPNNATYYMFYCGGDFLLWRIGYATSFSLNGPWTKSPSNPNFTPTPSAWDSYYVGFPFVIYDGNTNNYKMYYNGNNSPGAGKIGLATAPCRPGILNVPGEFTTIQSAINAAINGDTILVANGTYFENINFKGKAITVASRFLIDGNTNHITNTVINGSQPSHPDSGSVVTFSSGEDTTSVLYGFTITGGTGSSQGSVGKGGGGIKCHNSGAKILHNIIENNHVSSSTEITNGGGIAGGPINSNSWIIVENNTIRNNSVTNTSTISGSGALGAGISLFQNARVNNNIVEFNTAKCTYNTAWGGGILFGGSENRIRYCINNKIWYNKALSPTGTYYDGGAGGGLVVAGRPKADIRLNDIRYNEVEANVGLNKDSWGGGVLLQNQTSETIFAQNYVAFNKSINNSPCNGAGIATWNPEITGGPQIINNTITNNSGGTWGGGLFLGGTLYNNATLINNTICNNSATYGGAVFIGWSSIYPSHPKIINSILWNNGSSIYMNTNSTVAVRYSDVEGGYTGEGNINSNPLFADTSFRLADLSPCIGAGINSIDIGGTIYNCPTYCYFGYPRPSPTGSMPDIGACENPLPYPVPVELISFTAIVNDKEVMLNWSTATELNNQGFEVQRKFSSNNFVTIGSVRGHGTTTSPNNYTYVDKLIDAGKYFYRLKQIDYGGTFEYSDAVEVELRILDKFTLEQNYPNPFNPTTTIGYILQEKSNAKLTLLNALGEEIALLVNEEQEKGYYKVELDGSKLTSGVYFYKLVAKDFVSVKKMMLVK